MDGISSQVTNATNATISQRIAAGALSMRETLWRGEEIAIPRIDTTVRVRGNPSVANGTRTALSFREVIARRAEVTTSATARAISRTKTALVPFEGKVEEAVVGTPSRSSIMKYWDKYWDSVDSRPIERALNTGDVASVGTETAAATAGTAASAGAETTGAGHAVGSLLDKVIALGKSAWALAVAHPVITTAIVATAIAVPLIFIVWRKRRTKNTITPQGNEVSQGNELDDAS